MPSLVRVSGPVLQFLQFPGDNTIYYLGTSEKTPQYEEKRYYQAVMNTLSGSSLPFDETWDGHNMIISTELTRYDEVVLSRLRAAPFSATPTNPPFPVNPQIGNESRISRGTLMYDKMPSLIMTNTFFGTPNAKPNDLPGYLFYSVKLAGLVPTPGGTNANKIGIIFEAVSTFRGAGGGAGGSSSAPQNQYSFSCYTTTDPRIQQAIAVAN